jgi:hypothetical protein
MSDILAIVTGFHGRQLWQSITQSDFNLTQGENSVVRTGGPYNVPKSVSITTEPEYVQNLLKSLGSGQYKGLLESFNASDIVFVTDVQSVVNASQVYTLAKYDDAIVPANTYHPNRFFGSFAQCNATNRTRNPLKYRPLNDNATIVLCWENNNGFRRFNERLNENGTFDFIQITSGGTYDYGSWSPDFTYDLSDDTREGRDKVVVGFSMLEDGGFLAHLYADDHYTGDNWRVLRAYDCIKPYVGQNVAVKKQGSGYGINFQAINPVTAGLGYGTQNEYLLGDGGFVGGTGYPDDPSGVASGNIIGSNGGVQVTTLGGGQGMSVEFTALLGVIQTVNIVDSGLGYVAGDVITIKGNTLVVGNGDALNPANQYKITTNGAGQNYSAYTTDGNPAIAAGVDGTVFVADLGGVLAGAEELEDLTSEGLNSACQFIYADQTLSQRIEFDGILENGAPDMSLSEEYQSNWNAYSLASEVDGGFGNGYGQSQRCSNFTVRIKTGGGGELLDVRFVTQPAQCEDGDEFAMLQFVPREPVPPYPNPAQRARFATKRWFRNVPTTTGGAGIGLTVDFRRDIEGKIVEVRANTFGTGYLVGDVITIEGGNPSNPATITISETNVRATTALTGVGVGMEVELDVGTEGNLIEWRNGEDIVTNKGVRQIKITSVGTGYKSGDVIQVDGGNNDCTFGLFFAPEFGTGRNTVNPQVNVFERRWSRHWKSGDDYRFRMCNQAREVIDIDGAGLPLDPAEHPVVINSVSFGRGMARTGNGGSAHKLCDLNIREFDDPLDLTDLDTRFDPEALQPNATIDDLPPHARVFPLLKKDGVQAPDKYNANGGFVATLDGDFPNWEDTVGSNDIQTILRDMTDGNSASFGRSANTKFGTESANFTLEQLVQECGYIIDDILSVSITAHKVVDPDGDIMEIIVKKDGGTEYVQEERINSGDESTFHGYWGQGDPDFAALNLLKTDGVNPTEKLMLLMKRK